VFQLSRGINIGLFGSFAMALIIGAVLGLLNGYLISRFKLPTLIVTPHIAWASQEAANRLFDILVDNINRFVAGNPQNLV